MLSEVKISLPIPPVVVNIRGVNVLCSMSRTVLEYWRFFSFSCILYIFCGSRLLQDIWLEKPNIKECRSLVFAESMCKNDQPFALLAPLFSCSLLMS